MTSGPLVSRECVYVALDRAPNVEANYAGTLTYSKNEEGRLITGPRLLIGGSKGFMEFGSQCVVDV